jgi:hypothetical protein
MNSRIEKPDMGAVSGEKVGDLEIGNRRQGIRR